MKPLVEVCVGRHCCYDKEIPWHQWVASPALGYGPPGHTLTGRGVVPSGQPLVLWVKKHKHDKRCVIELGRNSCHHFFIIYICVYSKRLQQD